MPDDTSQPEAGWYPTPEGSQRYWDGSRWLDLPEPSAAADPMVPVATTKQSETQKKSRRRGLWVTVIVVAAIALGGGGATAVVSTIHADNVAAAKAAQQAHQRAAAAKAAADKADQKRARQKVERALREETVKDIESSVKKMAKGHVKDGFIDGPILDVTCSPVAGGSVDDLDQKTTEFQCFVANKKNSDGTESGYYYQATMNWDSGQFTYGFGKK